MSETDPVSLEKLINAILEEREKLYTAAWAAHQEIHRIQDEALSRAEHLREIRDEGQNEWRETLNDTLNRGATREMVDRLRQDFEARTNLQRDLIANQARELSNLQGRMQQTAVVLTILVAVGALVEHFIR